MKWIEATCEKLGFFDCTDLMYGPLECIHESMPDKKLSIHSSMSTRMNTVYIFIFTGNCCLHDMSDPIFWEE